MKWGWRSHVFYGVVYFTNKEKVSAGHSGGLDWHTVGGLGMCPSVRVKDLFTRTIQIYIAT